MQVLTSIKNSELGSDIIWIKKAISKVYKEMKTADVKIEGQAVPALHLQPKQPKVLSKSDSSRRELA
jgi:hypothetical protein